MTLGCLSMIRIDASNHLLTITCWQSFVDRVGQNRISPFQIPYIPYVYKYIAFTV
jgi:hypothetical protein